jgi:hypothetical protein
MSLSSRHFFRPLWSAEHRFILRSPGWGNNLVGRPILAAAAFRGGFYSSRDHRTRSLKCFKK